MQRFASFHEAFHGLLDELSDAPAVPAVNSSRSVGTQFGGRSRGTQEVLAHSFVITNPRDRVLPCRGADERYAVANFFWTMAEVGDPETISFYNPKGQAFVEDSELKCAIPARLKNSLGGSQLVDAVDLLKADPSSRRALVTFTRPEDMSIDALDYPCPATMQFLVREGRLTVIVNMRSQSVYGVLPYDVFLFTLIQECVAFELGVPLGEYIHVSNSAHFYEDERGKVAALQGCSLMSEPMPGMEDSSPVYDKQLLVAEERVRLANIFASTGSAYWDGLLGKLIV